MENSGEIHAGDIYEHKAELIADGANRLGISIVKTSVRDASVEDASAIGAYDRVLADVPCSGLGLLRKKPDIRLKKTAVKSTHWWASSVRSWNRRQNTSKTAVYWFTAHVL